MARHFGLGECEDWTEFPSNPSPVWWEIFVFSSCLFEILESDLLQDNFTMAFYSFGGVIDQCGASHGLYKKQECFLFCLAIVT